MTHWPEEGYPVKTTVEMGLFEGGQIRPITKYEIGDDGHRGAAQGEYSLGDIFNEQDGLNVSGAAQEELCEVLRYQYNEWGEDGGSVFLRIHSELNGIELVDYILGVRIVRPYMEITDIAGEMSVGQVQTLRDGKAEFYLLDADHDHGDYFDVVITGIELENAEDARYLKVEQDGADWKLTALKVSDKRVPLTVSFTGGPDGYDTFEAGVAVLKGVFAAELRRETGEKADEFLMLVGEKEKPVPYVTYTEGDNTTVVPAKKGGEYYYTVDYNFYDDRVIDVDDAKGEITALRIGRTNLDVVIRVYDKNGAQCYDVWDSVTLHVSASRTGLVLKEDAVLRVRPGQSLTAQQVMDAAEPVLTVYSMRNPEGKEYPIVDFLLEEVIGKEDELILADGEHGLYRKLNVSAKAAEGEASLIVHAVSSYGNRASAGLKVVVEASKEEQVRTCDTSTPAVVNSKTLEYIVDGGKGALTCEVADPSMATATVTGNKIKVKGLKAGNTKLIVKAAETNDYAAAEQEFDLKVITLGKTRRGDMFNLAGTVKVTWEAVPGAIWYKVYRSGKADPVIVTKALIGYDSAEGMTPGEKYTLRSLPPRQGKTRTAGS